MDELYNEQNVLSTTIGSLKRENHSLEKKQTALRQQVEDQNRLEICVKCLLIVIYWFFTRPGYSAPHEAAIRIQITTKRYVDKCQRKCRLSP